MNPEKEAQDLPNMADYEQREAKAVSNGRKNMSPEFSSRKVSKGGLFAEIRENNKVYPNHYKLLATDGVGSKLFLCQWLDRYDTIGFDLVAMNVNDLATFGAVTPDTFNAYFAVQTKIEEEKMGEIVKGIDDALKKCITENAEWTVNYGKFETASLDEMIAGPVQGYGFDLAASVSAFIKKSKLPSFDPKPGNVIVGFESSGLHSNGYTAARHALLKPSLEPRREWKKQYCGAFSLNDKIPGYDTTIGEAMLKPTEIYLRAMSKIACKIDDAFGVNITGYGLKNFNRFGEHVIYRITEPIKPHPIFMLLIDEGKHTLKEAWTKFNMGMGFAVITKSENDAKTACSIAEEEGHRAKIVGYVDSKKEKEPSVTLNLASKELGGGPAYEFKGYGA